MIGIINYGIGNISAFITIYKRLNMPAKVVSTPDDLFEVDRFILPGVGAFDWAISKFNNSGLRLDIEKLVLKEGTPILGVCVGMQMLACHSEEGCLEGLSWVPGHVKKFNIAENKERMQLPHMGWNDVSVAKNTKLFYKIAKPRFYFLHSYFFMPENSNHTLTITDYMGPFASCIRFENIYGVQFHPEKSHHWGIQLLKNFAEV